MALERGPRGSFAAALARALDDRGLTLRQVQQRLRARGVTVGLTTLSYWRSGQRTPERQSSMAVVTALERVLELPNGSLQLARGPSRRAGAPPSEPFDSLVPQPEDAAPFAERLLTPEPSELSIRSVHTVVDFGPDGFATRFAVRHVWRARRDGAQRFLTHLNVHDPLPESPSVRAVSGCSLGETVFDETSGTGVTEMLLPRALALHETAVTEHEFEGPFSPVPETAWQLALSHRVVEALLWVRFHPRSLPTECFASDFEQGVATLTRPLTFAGGQAQRVRWQFGPGSFGIQWIH